MARPVSLLITTCAAIDDPAAMVRAGRTTLAETGAGARTDARELAFEVPVAPSWPPLAQPVTMSPSTMTSALTSL